MPAIQPEPIIGREADIATLLGLLGERRLVTITALGGCGKTRLAQAVADRSRSPDFAVTFVDVSSVDDAGLLPATIVAALGASSEAADPIAAITSRIGEAPHLLVLDNLEQIAGAGASIATILEAAVGVTVLATSRRPLGIAGEMEFPLAPLDLPRGPDELTSAPASALFLERASSSIRMPLPDDTAAVVVELCRRLDGLPLAIELAAARTRILSPEEILSRLDARGLRAIEPGAGGERRSLAAIIEWTTGLLDAATRLVLEAATVCEGFDLDLLETVAPVEDASAPVEQLVTLGLVRVEGRAGTRTRYRLLETIREVVSGSVTDDRVRGWQTAHARTMAARADEGWARVDERAPHAVEEMEADLDNYRRSLAMLSTVDPDAALRQWRRMHPLWTNGRLIEAIDRFNTLAALARDDSAEMARGMPNMALYTTIAHGPTAAMTIHRRHLDVARRSGDAVAIASALSSLAMDALYRKDRDEAERILVALSALDLPSDSDAALHAGEGRAIAQLTIDGPTSRRALDTFSELAERARETKRSEMAMSWLGNVAFLHLCRDEWPPAEQVGLEALELADELNRTVAPILAGYVAIARAHLGRITEAAAVLTAHLDPAVLAGSAMPVADVLRAGATVAALGGDGLLAARLAGAASRVWEAEADELDAGELLLAERTMALVRRHAREIDVELAIRDGAAADTSELLRSLPASLTAHEPPAHGANATRLRHGELTRREIEILTLVGQGKSDPEIARELFISPKTASVHVANIKGKLGMDTRLEAALKARELGLV